MLGEHRRMTSRSPRILSRRSDQAPKTKGPTQALGLASGAPPAHGYMPDTLCYQHVFLEVRL